MFRMAGGLEGVQDEAPAAVWLNNHIITTVSIYFYRITHIIWPTAPC